MSAPAHPSWCSPTYCRAARRGKHSSHPTFIGGHDESGRWAVALVAESDGPAFVELVALSDDEAPGSAYVLSTGVARALGRTIAAHGAVAGES